MTATTTSTTPLFNITKQQRILDLIDVVAARNRIHGEARGRYWAAYWASCAGEHCAHVAEHLQQDSHLWGRLADEAEQALVALVKGGK